MSTAVRSGGLLARAACLVVRTRVGFLFKRALIGSNQFPAFQVYNCVLRCPSFQLDFFGVPVQCLFDTLWTRVFHIDRSAIFQPQNLPTWKRDSRGLSLHKRQLPQVHSPCSHESCIPPVCSTLLPYLRAIAPPRQLVPKSMWLHTPAPARSRNCC